MPRQIALLLCCVFVWSLLRRDRRQGKNVSWMLWVPTVWLLISSSRAIDLWLGITGGSRMSGGVLDPMFQVSLICAGPIILRKRGLNWSKLIGANRLLLLLMSYMLISMVWSDMPLRSFRSWVKELIAVLMAVVVLSEADPRQALQCVFRRFVAIVIPFSVLLVKYFPESGVAFSRYTGEVQWIGVTLHKSSLGQLCAISVFFLVWTFVRRRRGLESRADIFQTGSEGVLFLMTLWLMRGPSAWASSVTSAVGLSVSLLTYFAFLWMKRHRIPFGRGIWVATMAGIIGFGFLSPLVGGASITGLSSTLGRDETLTGRTEIWANLVPAFLRQPIFGYGYSAFYTPERLATYLVGQAHNGYLEVSLGLGIIGLVLTGTLLLFWARKTHRELKSDIHWGCFSSCLLLMLATTNISESSIDSFTTPMMAAVLFLSLSVPTAKNLRRVHQPRVAPEANLSFAKTPTVAA